MAGDGRLMSERFRRSNTYHPDWVLGSVSGGANSLWLTEWLAEVVPLRSGMRVLDLGCGRGASSIFLRRELGVEVWASDLWFSPGERLERIRDAGVNDGVFPVHTDARSWPFAPGFFDAVVSIDSFPYFGTDDLYASYIAQFVEVGGLIAIAGAGLTREIDGTVPEHLQRWWEPAMCSLHSADWWRRHWQRTASPDNLVELEALEADGGRYLGYVRSVGRRRDGANLEQPPTSVPVEYTKHPLLRP
jgi:SAM-dependent methyltransferase